VNGAVPTRADVVVVGAGLAGLAAAGDLLAAGRLVVVVEARDRVGGRTLDEPIGNGKVVEVGGQWIGPGQDRIAALARSLGVETFPTYAAGDNLYEFDGELSRFAGDTPRMSPPALSETARAILKLDGMARRVPLEAPWEAPEAAAWDSETFWSWLRRNLDTREAREFLELTVSGVWATDPADLSLLHALFYIHSAGGLSALVDTEGGAQHYRFVGGPQLVSVGLAERLGDRIALGSPVRRVVQSADGARVVADGGEFVCERVILALPPALAGRLVYDPPLPGLRDQMTQRMPQGSVIKCMALYEEPFWRKEGLSGQVISAAGPVRVVYDNSPPDGEPGVLVGFLEGTDARRLGGVRMEERRRAVIECFARFFGDRAARPGRYVEMAWAEEEYTRGCYAGYFTPGGWTSYGRYLREPVGRIHWAGTETATVWNGYMDGAVESGQRAAREVLAGETEEVCAHGR